MERIEAVSGATDRIVHICPRTSAGPSPCVRIYRLVVRRRPYTLDGSNTSIVCPVSVPSVRLDLTSQLQGWSLRSLSTIPRINFVVRSEANFSRSLGNL